MFLDVFLVKIDIHLVKENDYYSISLNKRHFQQEKVRGFVLKVSYLFKKQIDNYNFKNAGKTLILINR